MLVALMNCLKCQLPLAFIVQSERTAIIFAALASCDCVFN